MNREFLTYFRSLLIQLLNAIDDELGLPRTIPAKGERRLIKKVLDKSAIP